MTEPTAPPMRPFWSAGAIYDRFTSSDVDEFLAIIGTPMATSAHHWAAETTLGQQHLPQRSPQEWAAYYIDTAVETLRVTWHAIHSDTPSARHTWALSIRQQATTLLELLNARPGYDPADPDLIRPTVIALTNPYERPATLSTAAPENAQALVPLLSEMIPRHFTPLPYWVHPIEGWGELILKDVASSNAAAVTSALTRIPVLADAIRVAIAGLQLLECRSQAVADKAKAYAGGKQETGSRAIVMFAGQVGLIYRRLVGECSPLEGGPTRPRRTETRFYQRVALRASEVLHDEKPELVHLLRGRGAPHGFDTAANDLREAWSSGGGSPRKR